MLQSNQAIWRSTKESTLRKSLTDAQCASFPVFKLVNWKFTWWGSTQEKSQTSAISATTRVHLLVGYKAIWRHTLGKSLSIVTYAAKLTVIKATSQTILRFTLPRSDSWSNFSRQKITKIPIDRSSLLNPLQTQLRKVASYIYVVLDKLDPEQLGPTVWGQFAKNHSAYRMTMENETSYRNMLVDW